MSGRRLVTSIFVGFLLMLVALALPSRSSFGAGSSYQTWPSRTPTPAPAPTEPPTKEPPDSGGGGDEPTAVPPTVVVPTSTTSPSLTPIPLVTATAVEPFATSEPCGTPPTILARSQLTVRGGPGEEFAQLARLAASEVRPIVGRSADSPWWFIQLTASRQGWVADRDVIVHGYTGEVPLADSEEPGDGLSPNEQAWNPTPDPDCAQATDTAIFSPTELATEIEPSELAESEKLESDEKSELETGLETVEDVSATVIATPTPAAPTGAAEVPPALQPATTSAQETGTNLNWILFAGIGLVVVGVATFIGQRLRS